MASATAGVQAKPTPGAPSYTSVFAKALTAVRPLGVERVIALPSPATSTLVLYAGQGGAVELTPVLADGNGATGATGAAAAFTSSCAETDRVAPFLNPAGLVARQGGSTACEAQHHR